MQENRSFDHYFGTLRGVRGFGDPHPVTLPSGKSVWHQPTGAGELLPFRPDVPDLGQTYLPDPPRGWTDGHKHLTDTWPLTPGYDLSVHGPNGFFRRFAGGGPAVLDVEPSYGGYSVVLKLHNGSSRRVEVTVQDRYGSRPIRLSPRPYETERHAWSLVRTHGWYDLTVTIQGDGTFEYRYAGHLENGEDSISDPAMGGLL
jgi:phospholipase C